MSIVSFNLCINFTGVDTNDGVTVTVSVVVSGTDPKTLIIKANVNDGYYFEWSDGTEGEMVVADLASAMTLSGSFSRISTLSDETGSGNSNMWYYLVILFVIIAIVVVLFARTRNKEK